MLLHAKVSLNILYVSVKKIQPKMKEKFSKVDYDFLLIDEPTNHLDACIDHILVLNRHSIEVQNGNFSSWWENKSRKAATDIPTNDADCRPRCEIP